MNGKDYQNLAMRTNDGKSEDRLKATMLISKLDNIDVGGVLNGCLGLTGEAGEVTDMIKKWIFHEKPLATEHLKKEIGDVMWYVAMLCKSFGFDLDEIMEMNVEKLKNRYPEGFDTVRANNRAKGDI